MRKNDHLGKFLEPVDPYDFYREVFPEGTFERKGHFEDAKGNGIALTIPNRAQGIALQIERDGRAKRYTITDDLEILDDLHKTDFTIISPISYFEEEKDGSEMPGISMPWSLTWTAWGCLSSATRCIK